MSLVYVGSVNLGILSPLSLSVSASLTASLVADLQVLIDLVLDIGIIPPTFALSLSVIADLFANLTLSLEITPPLVEIELQIGIMAQVIIELTLQLSLCLPFSLLLDIGADAGIFVYGYGGTGRDFGPAVSSALATSWPNQYAATLPANALIIATVSPPVWTNVASFFDILPPSLPDGLTYLANANLGLCCGLALKATGPLIADLRARLKGALALSASLHITLPTFAGSIIACLSLLLALEAAIAVGLPGITFQLEAIAKATVALEAKLALLLKLTLALGGGGADVFTYSGPGNSLGPALTLQLATSWPDGASSHVPANAIVLGTTTPAAWAGLSAFFGGI